MKEKEEEIKEKKEEDLLKELCEGDEKMHHFLRSYLLLNPLTGISKKDLDILIEEAERSRDFRPAVDKAIFEAAKNPAERERYIKILQKIALNTTHTMEQEKEKMEKEGAAEQARYLGIKIENVKFLNQRTEDIINKASVFYNEILLNLEENARREARGADRRSVEWKGQKAEETERSERKARKIGRGRMDREGKKAAKDQEKREDLAIAERKKARGEEKINAERKEREIEELEKAQRKSRKNERIKK